MRFAMTLLLALLAAAPVAAQSGAPPQWEFWAGVDFVFADDDIVAPTIMADSERWHLEARYNYEGENTTSLWGGWNFRAGDGESWIVTPMLGAAFGDTRGILPGAEVIANWKVFDVYLELEHLFSSGGDDEDFTYYWAELAASPVDWLRAGVVSQSTWIERKQDEVQHGGLLGFSWRSMTLTTFLFDAGTDDETVVVTAAIEF